MTDWARHYDEGVPSQLTFTPRPLTELLAESSRRWPRRAAIWSEQGALSYEQLLAEVRKFASALVSIGLAPGERVAQLLPNSPQALVALYGTLWAGGVATLVAPETPIALLERQLKDARPRVGVVPSPLSLELEEVLRRANIESFILSSGREYTRYLRGWLRVAARLAAGRPERRYLRWRRLMREANETFPRVDVDPAAPAVIVYTGGTTGSPRGVVLSHRALVANTEQLSAWDARLRPGQERLLCALPFYHAYGLSAAVNLSMANGGTLLLPPEPTPDSILETISRFRPSLFPGVPVLYAALLNTPRLRSYGLSSIRACISGAAPLPVEIQESFEKVSKGRLVEGYGLTEAGPVTHANPLEGPRRSGSIGLPLPGTEALVVDLESGEELPHGEVGELLVRGPQLMDGYFEAPEATARVLRGGWLHTGDMAQRNQDGFFYLINRRGDVLRRDDRLVFPRDVEEVIYEHPAVQDAAVVGWPAAGEGPGPHPCQELRGFVCLRPQRQASGEEIRSFCERRLPASMVPARVEILAQLPRTRLGKLLRRELGRS
ncbi:MAG: long-chain-fatty-acid--CoA ligase [Candidatus Xenobia bacterium]